MINQRMERGSLFSDPFFGLEAFHWLEVPPRGPQIQVSREVCHQRKRVPKPGLPQSSWWYTYPSEKYESQLG